MTPYIQVMTTLPDQPGAEKLAAHLLETQLAACVQISPCTSWYRWRGAIEQSGEMVCTIKSRRDLFPELCRAIRAMHPYEVPEILASPVVDGGASYLDWLEKELRPAKEND
ncbi:MAG: divalent-cation tolerance protein CutA [Desulfobulbus sp.]